jgi:hypothetical protein
MNITVTLVNPGASVGPFDIYSNVDSFTTPISTGVSRSALVAGYNIAGVSDLTATVKLVSTGSCNSVIFLPVTVKTPTTTTSTSTNTSTSTSTSTTTTSTTLAPAVPTKISVTANTVAGTPQDCLGTSYPVSVTTATVNIYDQYDQLINAATSINVVIRCNYAPCTGPAITITRTITVPAGASGTNTSWDSSRTVDCGGFGCILETDQYSCALSNSASLAWKSGTTSC